MTTKHWTEFTGFEWLLVDIASRFGHDKWHFSDRIEWAATNVIPVVKACNTLADLKACLDAAEAIWGEEPDEKPMFAGACLALYDTLKGFESNWQIGQDAASSGPQLLSTLLKCKTGMYNCGVLGTHMPDLYTTVTEHMSAMVKIARKIVKKGIVPHIYASESAPKRIFKKNYPHFLEAYKGTVPMAQFASDWMVDAWNPHATEYSFLMPDAAEVRLPVIVNKAKEIPLAGHKIKYEYTEIGMLKKGEEGTKSLSANTTHPYDGYMLRELNRRANYDPVLVEFVRECLLDVNITRVVDKENYVKVKRLVDLFEYHNQFSIVIFEYIQPDNAHLLSKELRDMLLAQIDMMQSHAPFEITNIHDEFKTLPKDVTQMKIYYNQLLCETYMSDWWRRVATQLTGTDPVMFIGKPDESLLDEIMAAPYAIG